MHLYAPVSEENESVFFAWTIYGGFLLVLVYGENVDLLVLPTVNKIRFVKRVDVFRLIRECKPQKGVIQARDIEQLGCQLDPIRNDLLSNAHLSSPVLV